MAQQQKIDLTFKGIPTPKDPNTADSMWFVVRFEQRYEDMWTEQYDPAPVVPRPMTEREKKKEAKRKQIEEEYQKGKLAERFASGELNTYFDDPELYGKDKAWYGKVRFEAFQMVMYLMSWFMSSQFVHFVKPQWPGITFWSDAVYYTDADGRLCTRLHALIAAVAKAFESPEGAWRWLRDESSVRHAENHFGVTLEELVGVREEKLEDYMQGARKLLKCGVAVPAFGWTGRSDCVYHRSRLNYVQNVLVPDEQLAKTFDLLPSQRELLVQKRNEYFGKLVRVGMTRQQAGKEMGDPQ